MSLSRPTIDGVPNLHCMVVAVSAEQEDACREAIVPVPVVRAASVRDACTSMSTVLPLAVVVDEGISDADRDALTEFTTACGAEIVTIERTPVASVLAKRLFDAIIVAERRRVGARRG